MTDKKDVAQIRNRVNQFLKSDKASLNEARILLREMNDRIAEQERREEELEGKNRDLTSVEREYTKFRSEYSDLFENAPVGVVVIDDDRVIHKVNRTFLKDFVHLHGDVASFRGRLFDDFIYPESRPLFYHFCQTLRRPGSKVPLEIKLFDLFRVPRDVAVTTSVFQENSPLHHLAFYDISLQKSREAELVKARKAAEEANRRKSQFLASLSHELRASLTTIVGNCELLGIQDLSAKTQEKYLKSIQTAGQMLTSLNEEMLDLSLLESGNLSLQTDNVNIIGMCEEIALFAQNAVLDKNIQVRCQMDHIPILLGDQKRLRQIIMSVISHAVSNATAGTILLRGRFVQNDSCSGLLVLNIIGENIFSGESGLKIIGRRLPPAERNSIGLGLYNTNQILKTMNGKMFWIHPLNSLRIEIPLTISPNPSLLYNRKSPEALSPGTGRTCLLVDDVQQNLDVLNAVMQYLGYTTTATNSAKEALNLMTEKHYDFVITDLWMPEMNGEELAEAVRQNADYDDIPLYAITADVDYEQNFDMNLFKSVLLKPITIEKVRKYVVTMKKWKEDTEEPSQPSPVPENIPRNT